LLDATTLERAMWLTGLEAAKCILSNCYSKTDSRLYSCVTFCDPRLKGYYCLDAKYENDWIEKAKSQVRDVYTAKYALHSHIVSQLSSDRVEKGDSVQRAMTKRTHSYMNDLSLYEDGYPAPIGADPLAWWKLHETEFPGIARMSLDMLAIPATTANVERVFSKAKLILTDGCSLLDADVAGKIASMGSWFRDLGIGKETKSKDDAIFLIEKVASLGHDDRRSVYRCLGLREQNLHGLLRVTTRRTSTWSHN
jgi:hAT family C-terminal dimerisation region